LLHIFFNIGLTLFLILPSVRVLNGADGLVINLKEEAAARSNTIFLNDVADLRNADPNSLRMVGQISLGPAPEFGCTIVLSRHQIQERIQTEAGSLSGAVLSGADAVQVQRQGRPADFTEIASLLKSHLLETTPWKTAEIEIRSIGGVKGIELPPDAVELRLSSNPTIVGRRRIMAPIEVVHAGKILRCFWVTADVSVHASILAASRRIPLDKLVTPEDLVETVADIPNLRGAYVMHPEEILGKASRRTFSAGDPLTREAFSDPFLVRHGETVRMRLERNGIVVTALARAEQDGKLGQVITVRNLEFSATLKAEVVGRAAVKLQ
jgi:flagella basal body P-ring formation protein FlgA